MDTNNQLIPHYLYHYTSIENLALILKNHTIRFSSLDRMDDLQEKESRDIKNAGQFVYVSAWTADKEESIPMWNMYASLNSGVRIRLKSNPFYRHANTIEELKKVSVLPVQGNPQSKPLYSYIPLSDMLLKGFYCLQAMGGAILHKVEYTNDTEKLYPTLRSEDGEKLSILLGKMGMHKNTRWKFQNEWRYILHIVPLNLNQPVDHSENAFLNMMNKMIDGTERQLFPYYDMKLDDEIFALMEITVSPRLSLGNRTILDALVSMYNPTAQIHRSSLEKLL